MKRILLLLLLPSIAFGLDVTLRVDGRALRSIDADRVNIITSDTGILIDVRTEPKTPTPPSPPPTPPKPPPPKPPSTCDQRPLGTQISDLNWRRPKGQTTHALGTGVRAFRFTSTANPAYEGQVATSFTTTSPAHRTVWISQCPGDPSKAAPHCVARGYESAVLHWTQNPAGRIPCKLELNTQYYINVKNTACKSGNCPFFMIVYSNQQP